MYSTHRPCSRCALNMVDYKLKKVVYFPTKFPDGSSMILDPKDVALTNDIAERGGMEIIEYDGDLNWMRDRIEWMAKLGVFG